MKPETHYLMVDIQSIFDQVIELQTRIDLLCEDLQVELTPYLKSIPKFERLKEMERERKRLGRILQDKDHELFILSNIVQ